MRAGAVLPAVERDGLAVGLLVSVRDVAEAALASSCGAGLVDAKDPARGALGALSPEIVVAIARAAREAGHRPLVSAVAGEPETIDDVGAALGAMSTTGVDFLKLALPSALYRRHCDLKAILGRCSIPVIAVLFADDHPDPALVPFLAEADFAGAMIDTRLKDGRRLPDHLPAQALAGFTEACREMGLISGLAGSLALADIPSLACHRPSYLGFRGGLCASSDRGGALDPGRIREAVRLLAPAGRREAA
jgi:uncharacterized protein (UPF0264 family)